MAVSIPAMNSDCEKATFFRRSIWALLIGLMPAAAHAIDRPDWAFPVADKVQPPSIDDNQPKTLAGSTKSFTQKQIDDLKNPPDWFPDMHPMLPVVAQDGATFASGSCHLPVGTGHDEFAYRAAWPAAYIVRRMADFKSGARKGFGDGSTCGFARCGAPQIMPFG